MKHCKLCNTNQPLTEFSKNKRYADGLWTYCKTCDRERMRARRAADPAHEKDIVRRYVDKHRDAINARKRARRAAAPEQTKAQRAADYVKYRERELEAMRNWKARNRDHMRSVQRERYWTDPDAARARQQTYRDANVGKARAWRMARITRKLQATPVWADNRAIAALYVVAARVTACTGIPHEVDHIVPLQGAIGRRRVVSGLHVEYNLRVVPRAVNRSKSNFHWPDMPV